MPFSVRVAGARGRSFDRSLGEAGRLLAASLLAAVLALGAPSRAAAASGMDWNDYGVRWQPYTLALSMAKRESKPILLVVYTEWCPHCASYSKLFHDPRVVAKAKELVLVRVDADEDEALARRFAPDGQYIPRTFVLSSAGELVADIQEPGRDKSRYFLDTRDPASLLEAMDQAVAKAR